jgi:hypothetical protein
MCHRDGSATPAAHPWQSMAVNILLRQSGELA